MYNIIAILISLVVPSFVLIEPIKEKRKLKECKFEIVSYILMVIGFLLRAIAIDIFPNGLNVDETSSGYEAYSILNFGIDRNGNSFPVFLKAWGSGQNALLTYLIMPFVALFGLSELTTRLPMAIFGCISLVAMYYLLKNIFENKKITLIGLAFFVICPWHIMKTRWALESNLFPDMVLYSILLIILSLKKKKNFIMYIAFAILGLTSYSYGTSYFFLPIFISILLIYLLKKKEITWTTAIISLAISVGIALPMIIFVIINTFDLPEIKLFGIFTVPRLVVNRYEEVTGIFSGKFLINCLLNFKDSVWLLITQHDAIPWNEVEGIGMTYLISFPLMLLGIYVAVKKYKENLLNTIMNIWGISAFLLLFVCEPNVNRINVIVIPMVYYTVIGIYEFLKMSEEKSYCKYIKYGTPILYSLFFGVFAYKYVTLDYGDTATFKDNVKEMVEYVANDGSDEVYVLYSFKEPYIYFLYYLQYNTLDFIDTAKLVNSQGTFDNIEGFGKYHFFRNVSAIEEIEEKRKEGKKIDMIVDKEAPIQFQGDKIELERFYIYCD